MMSGNLIASSDGPWSPDDDELLSLIALAAGDPPAWVAEHAAAAWEWRDADRSIAELIDDSALMGTARSAQTSQRTVAYTVGDFSLELTIEERGAHMVIDLTTVPARSMELTVTSLTASGETTKTEVALDAYGSGTLDVPHNARISLRADTDTKSFVTPWLTI